MTDATVVNLADKKLVDKIREHETMSDEEWVERGDEHIQALEAAGLLVSAADTFAYFPHPDWIQRIDALGLDDKGKEEIISYLRREWREGMAWLQSIEMAGVERATTAYAKLAKQKGFVFEQPDLYLSTLEEHDGWVIADGIDVKDKIVKFNVYDDPTMEVGIRVVYWKLPAWAFEQVILFDMKGPAAIDPFRFQLDGRYQSVDAVVRRGPRPAPGKKVSRQSKGRGSITRRRHGLSVFYPPV